jgi:hypothetical protein
MENVVCAAPMAIAAERGFARKTIGDLVAARSILHLDCLDEESVEELLMHVMLEIIIAAPHGDRFDSQRQRRAKRWRSGTWPALC